MHDIGGLVWVIIVILAIFSSIRKNVKQARESMAKAQQQSSPAQRPTPSPVPIVQPSPVPPQPAAVVTPLQRALQLSPIIAPAPASPPILQPVPPPPTPSVSVPTAPARAAAPDPFHPDSIQRRPSSGLLGGIFEDKNAILRTVIGAEILGKPKALQEQSIWSPRHSEPSI